MKKVLIHTLLKSYSLLVIGIVIFFASILSYISWYQYDTNRIRIQQEVADGLKEELDYYQGRGWELSSRLHYGQGSSRQSLSLFSIVSFSIPGLVTESPTPDGQTDFLAGFCSHSLSLLSLRRRSRYCSDGCKYCLCFYL